MKKLVVLFLAAVLCSPGFGEILVYKTSVVFNPLITWLGNDTASVETADRNGYIVLEVEAIDDDTWALINPPTLIFYGKEGKQKWYDAFDMEEDADTGLVTFNIANTERLGVWFFYHWNDSYWGEGYSSVYGKCNLGIKIGKRKVMVPHYLKGVFQAGGEENEYVFCGNITNVLSSNFTKIANKSGLTQEQTAYRIIAFLEKNNYKALD